MRVKHRFALAAAASVAVSAIVAAGVVASPLAEAQSSSFIGGFSPSEVATTVPMITGPGNGDINPYGVAVVRQSQGNLVKGDILVSNFNNSSNQQGTGSTIVEIPPTGLPAGASAPVFAQINAADLPGRCPGGVGLTTALTILNGGWVVVGSLPTATGRPDQMQAGCLIVLNSEGKVVTTFSGHGINGPWDMTSVNFGRVAVLFVTNVLNGTVFAARGIDTTTVPGPVVLGGTVLRLLVTTPSGGHRVPRLLDSDVIGSGFPQRTDPSALVIGPTGVGLGRNGTLYVADSLSSRIAAIPNALFRERSARTGRTVSVGGPINGPLGLAIAPGGDILTANSGDGNIVETTPRGIQVAVILSTPGGAGSLFGIAVAPRGSGVYFVDDSVNTLNLLS
jgi:hypothetical protein